MITLENLQDAAVWAFENDIDSDEWADIQDFAVFAQTYAQTFGLHPSSVLVGLRLGYLADMASRGELEDDEPVVEVPDRPDEEEFDSLPKLDLDKALRGVENDPED